MTRTKDFGGSEDRIPVSIRYGNLSLNELSWSNIFEYNKLKDDSVLKHEIASSSKLPRINLGIDYKSVPVGVLTIWDIDKERSHCYLSYWVEKSHRRKGIASGAIALATDYCFSTLGINEVEAPIQEDNRASKYTVMKLFFKISGYELFPDAKGNSIPHEVYLQTAPSEDEEMELIDYVSKKYSYS